jgi:hypothetical protein
MPLTIPVDVGVALFARRRQGEQKLRERRTYYLLLRSPYAASELS